MLEAFARFLINSSKLKTRTKIQHKSLKQNYMKHLRKLGWASRLFARLGWIDLALWSVPVIVCLTFKLFNLI